MFFVFFLPKISILSVVLFPVFYLGGIRFVVEVAAAMCVTGFGALHANVEHVVPVQRGQQQSAPRKKQNGKGEIREAVVRLRPVQTDKHM